MIPGEVHFEEKDLPLRRDVSELGALLGDVIREQHSEELFELVETARNAARARRAGRAEEEGKLVESLRELEPTLALELVRAFSNYFGLVNLAERVHRIRRRMVYRKTEGAPQPGGFEAALGLMKDQGLDADAALENLGRILVEPVFTAHPTEAVRRTILVKEQRIARALVDRFGEDTPRDVDETVLARVRTEVTTAWQTQEHLTVRPTVADEVEHATFYLTDVVYRVIPRVYADLERAVGAVYGEEHARRIPSPLVRFASWVGGDMDGNPNVGANTMRTTLARHAERILRRYLAEVRELHGFLSQSTSRVGVSSAVLQRCAEYRARLPEVYDTIPARYLEMPYRVLLWFVAARLERTLEDGAAAYEGPAELISDLLQIHESLVENKGASAGAFRVRRLYWRVVTFGFHLATLDVRQDSEVHRRVVGLLLGDPEFAGSGTEPRTRALEAALAKDVPPGGAPVDAEVTETLEVVRAIRESRERYGPEAIGPYIISMAQGADDALAVLYLARRGGLAASDGSVPLDVCPLFETVDDLERARATMEDLLTAPSYRAHLEQRGMVQHVMLGYSDSNKDSGLASSRWALQQAQIELVSWAEAAGVQLVLFHGRGGSISRGGTKPRNAILQAPPGAVRGRLRMTEQGEIIHAKYGLRGIAVRTLELLIAAVLERDVTTGLHFERTPEWDRALDLLAGRSREAYRNLVHEHPDFHEYFREATPIDVIERLRIGSRPASRRKQAGIRDLRAIPWVFAWTQSRHVLPGWYGLGTGLEALVEDAGLPLIREMASSWLFLRTLLSDAEMVCAKADIGIAAHYAELAGRAGQEIFPVIREEYERTCRMLREVLEVEELLQKEPVLQRAIRLRNPYVDPMSLLQVDLLRRWRSGGREDPALEEALLTTVQGIARGLQNTG